MTYNIVSIDCFSLSRNRVFATNDSFNDADHAKNGERYKSMASNSTLTTA